jgi:hypothetical protein
MFEHIIVLLSFLHKLSFDIDAQQNEEYVLNFLNWT